MMPAVEAGKILSSFTIRHSLKNQIDKEQTSHESLHLHIHNQDYQSVLNLGHSTSNGPIFKIFPTRPSQILLKIYKDVHVCLKRGSVKF